MKLKPHHKKFLHGLHKNHFTTLWSIEKKRQALLYFHNDLENIAYDTVRRFYKNELDLSYKRCAKPIPVVTLNFSALAGMLVFIKEKIEQGYELYSLDETGFGSSCLRRYAWSEKGKPVQPKFNKQKNLTLLACISSAGVGALQFIEGGNN